MTKLPAERIVWAIDPLEIRPSSRILEVGCGSGMALELITPRLTDGLVVGVDRSATAIAAATRRNARSICAGRAACLHVDLHALEPGADRFDLVFAIRVSDFHRGNAAAAMDAVAGLLRPGGRLHLFYDGPQQSGAGEALLAIERSLTAAGWSMERGEVVTLPSTSIAHVVGAPRC